MLSSQPIHCLSYIVAGRIVRRRTRKKGEDIVRLVTTMRGGDRPKAAHKEFADVSVMPRSMWEPWILFRKPIEDRVQDNLRKWENGWIPKTVRCVAFRRCDSFSSHPQKRKSHSAAPQLEAAGVLASTR